jgi:hypothetical protein
VGLERGLVEDMPKHCVSLEAAEVVFRYHSGGQNGPQQRVVKFTFACVPNYPSHVQLVLPLFTTLPSVAAEFAPVDVRKIRAQLDRQSSNFFEL